MFLFDKENIMISKILTTLICFILNYSLVAYADISHKEASTFFQKYTEFANTYNSELLNLYSPDAKIIREIVKPDGKTEAITVPAERYFKELKIGQKTAKLRRYKNKYRNITVTETPNGVRISAERQPSRETYWLKMYQVIENTNSGLKIKEEMMQTKVQDFLKHKNRGK